VDVREVAPAASGDEYFLSDAFGMVEQDYTPTTASRFDRAHHSSCACSQDYDINLLHACSPLLSSNPDPIACSYSRVVRVGESLVLGGCATIDSCVEKLKSVGREWLRPSRMGRRRG
jgi:hypothetical protein